jgi:hypothetical protein
MERAELIRALRRMKVETGSLVCLGCGHEHNCSTSGCAIIRAAAEELAFLDWAVQSVQLRLAAAYGNAEDETIQEVLFCVAREVKALFQRKEATP